MDFAAWLLTAAERGNPRTGIDQRHPGGAAFTCGNEVRGGAIRMSGSTGLAPRLPAS